MKGPIFSQHFPTQVSPHYIQLDPIYYDCKLMINLNFYSISFWKNLPNSYSVHDSFIVPISTLWISFHISLSITT